MLGHPLAEYIPPSTRDLSPARSEQEIIAFRAVKASQLSAALQDESFSLVEIINILTKNLGLPANLRLTAARTKIDSEGNYILYPPASLINQRLTDLDEWFSAASSTHPDFAFVVVFAALLNLHPLSDGNGRLARLLYNLLADRNSDSLGGFYLPISELAIISRNGFLVRLRSAQYLGDWSPLCDFIAQSTIAFFNDPH
jgi:Fic family protein